MHFMSYFHTFIILHLYLSYKKRTAVPQIESILQQYKKRSGSKNAKRGRYGSYKSYLPRQIFQLKRTSHFPPALYIQLNPNL